MSLIYLRHSTHGCKIATLEDEAIYDESNGWVRYDPRRPVPAGDAPPNGMTTRRRGRAPVQQEPTPDDDGSGAD
jgi:hypothetical protein